MKRAETTNTFNNGLVMDIHPLVAPNDSMCNALNATLITFNGNENALQCDMGNGRVETAYLPEGYVPIGTTELGGVIYIVSYNPLIDKCQIGSFPSPERNITSDELGITNISLKNSDFVNAEHEITNLIVKKKLSDFTLNPGDKFLVSGTNLDTANLSCYDDTGKLEHNYLKLSIATIDSNGRTVYLKDLIKRPYKKIKYLNINSGTSSSSSGVDEYRKVIGSDYDIFNSKIAGNLYLIAELEVVDTFTVTWELVTIDKNGYTISFYMDTTSSNGRTLSKIYTNPINGTDHIWSVFSNHVSSNIIFPLGSEKESITFTPCMPFGICKWLETTINIDFSLLGTGTITNDIWQYYKESSQMIMSYNLDCYLGTKQNVEFVRHYFIPCGDVDSTLIENLGKVDLDIRLLSNYFYYELPKRRAYSGHYNNNITFQSGFEENSLYLVATVVKKIIPGETSETTSQYSVLKHWMYTNGVFNSEYIKQNNNNFDNIKLPLEYNITSSPDFGNLVETYTTQESAYLYSEAPTKNIQGKTILSISANQVDLNLKLGFKNNYNSFEVDQVDLVPSNIKSYLSYSADQLNTGATNIDSDFVKIVQNVDAEGKVNDTPPTSEIDHITTSINANNTLKLTGKFYNPISANAIERNVKVENYYAPVLHNQEDLSKYGLYIEGGKFKMDTTFVGLGMSNGGSDNQGGGGIMHVNGIVELGYSSSKLQQISASVKTGTSDGGEVGYDSLPNQEFSSYINESLGGRVIAPILLVNAGTNHFTFKYSASDYKNLTFSDVGDRAKESDQRVNWFKETQDSSYRFLWLFIKTSNQTIITYAPLNDFFKITNLSLTDPKDASRTLPQILGSLLSQLFVRRTSQELRRYTVNDISYFDNLIEYINIKGDVKLPGNVTETTTTIKISGVELNDLYKCFSANCLQYDKLNVSNAKLNATHNIQVKNLLLDTYLEYQANTSGLDNYVYNPIDSASEVSIKKDSSSMFYSWNSDRSGIQPIYSGISLGYVIDVQENGDNLAISVENTNLLTLSNIASFFTFDSRTQELLLNNSKYNSSSQFQGRWGSHKNEKDGNWTSWKNVSVFNKQPSKWPT